MQLLRGAPDVAAAARVQHNLERRGHAAPVQVRRLQAQRRSSCSSNSSSSSSSSSCLATATTTSRLVASQQQHRSRGVLAAAAAGADAAAGASSPDADGGEVGIYDVEELRGIRASLDGQDPVVEYRVRWKDGSPDTW
jgi:hypothetical protein